MLGPLGIQELVLIAAVALLVLGPKRLPEAAAAVGRALRALRGAADDAKRAVEREIEAPPPQGKPPAPDKPDNDITK